MTTENVADLGRHEAKKIMVGLWGGSWKLVLFKGIIAITLGIMAWAWPGITLSIVIILFGSFSLVGGISSIVGSVRSRKENEQWKWGLTAGIFGTIIGILVFAWPLPTAFVILIFIALWIMVMSIFSAVNAVRFRKQTPMGLPLAVGIIGIVFAILIFASPLGGAVALLWIWATYGIIYGTLLCIHAHSVRRSLRAQKI